MISVGNLAMGGRGKSPTTAAVARLLVAAGEHPAILSRGYRRRIHEDGVVIVGDGRHLLADIDRSGDEPLMLARQVPGAAVLVSDVRAQAAALAETTLDVTVHVLDDGFQHRSLARDIDLVIVQPSDLRDRRLPFGRLRTSPRALAHVDAILIDGADVASVTPALDAIGVPATTPRFALSRTLGTPWRLEGEAPVDREQPVLAAAGIARPERFVTALREAGWQVASLLPFADHHEFTEADLARMARAARNAGVDLVMTTEKDAMRLLPWRPLPVAVAAVPLSVTVEPQAAFSAWLLERLREVRAC